MEGNIPLQQTDDILEPRLESRNDHEVAECTKEPMKAEEGGKGSKGRRKSSVTGEEGGEGGGGSGRKKRSRATPSNTDDGADGRKSVCDLYSLIF